MDTPYLDIKDAKKAPQHITAETMPKEINIVNAKIDTINQQKEAVGKQKKKTFCALL